MAVSLVFIFCCTHKNPEIEGFPGGQWLGLSALTAMAHVWSLVRKQRSHKLHGVNNNNKKKSRNNTQNICFCNLLFYSTLFFRSSHVNTQNHSLQPRRPSCHWHPPHAWDLSIHDPADFTWVVSKFSCLQTVLRPITSQWVHLKVNLKMRLSGWLSGKESDCQCKRHKRLRFNPWVGKTPWSRKRHPFHDSCLENSIGRGAWWATVHGVAQSQTWLSNWAESARMLEVPWGRDLYAFKYFSIPFWLKWGENTFPVY